MKKNKILTVYSILVSVIFVVAIAFFGIGLYKEYSNGYVRTRKTFDEMNSAVKKILRSTDKTSQDFQSKITNSIGSLDDYFYLEIKYNGGTIFMYSPKGYAPAENTNMMRLYFSNSKIGDNSVYVNAAMYTLRPSTIANYARTSFIVILVFTVLTILLIIYISIFANTSNVSETTANETLPNSIGDKLEVINLDNDILQEEKTDIEDDIIETPTEEETSIENSEENKTPEIENVTNPTDNGEFENYDIPVPEGDFSSEEDNEQQESGAESEGQKEETVEESELPVSDNMPAEIEKPQSANPEGLFSPATGFGWESYLMTRLENELERATSLEFDLILFIIKIANIERTPELMEKLSEILINTFQFKDLIFEYKEDGFAAIKTNCTIDDAIPIADRLHTDISTIITELGGKCYIGLTSRTIRLVSAERLLKEADSALNHALEDENAPIIAFRANTEKYLDFVEGRD